MTTVITGASKGIGLELTKQLIAMNKNVISCARSDGFTFLDLERQSSIYALRDELLDTPINLLVCNAGVFLDKGESINSGYPSIKWEKTFSVNVTSVFLLIQCLLPNIIKAKGKIAIISSEAYRDLTIIKSNRTRLILQAASNKSIQIGFYNILAD